MQAQTSAPSAPQFVVEVSDPTDPHWPDREYPCSSLEELAVELDEQIGWGKGVCEEIAEQVAAGDPFEEEVDGLEVTARVAGGRS